jgi:ubiquinone/menaquinone biosynthesis C-methylase UbiE
VGTRRSSATATGADRPCGLVSGPEERPAPIPDAQPCVVLADNRSVSEESGVAATPPTLAGHFTQIAQAYQRYWSDALLPASRQLVDSLPMAPARSVLEVGAGVGALYPTLAEAAPRARIVLTDPAGGMLRIAPTAAARAQVTADQLPFRDGSFDVAVAAFMIQYVPDARHTLREVRRVLRRGGHVGIVGWGTTAESIAGQQWMARLDAAGAPPATRLASYFEATDSAQKLREILNGAGYLDVDVRLLPWSDQPDLETFLHRQQLLGASGRRLAAWDPTLSAEFVSRMRLELAALSAQAFLDRSEVLAVTARTP